VRRNLLASLGLATTVALAVAGCGGAAAPSAASSPAPAAASASASEAPASAQPAGASGAVTIAGFAFSPASLTVKVGTTVTWTNTDSATHTVVWADGTRGSGSLTAGGTPYTRTFDTPGTFAYKCGIHASMTGTVVVQP
jgi:plastocyanin